MGFREAWSVFPATFGIVHQTCGPLKLPPAATMTIAWCAALFWCLQQSERRTHTETRNYVGAHKELTNTDRSIRAAQSLASPWSESYNHLAALAQQVQLCREALIAEAGHLVPVVDRALSRLSPGRWDLFLDWLVCRVL